MERWWHLLLGRWLWATAETPVAPAVGAVVIAGRWLGCLPALGWAGLGWAGLGWAGLGGILHQAGNVLLCGLV